MFISGLREWAEDSRQGKNGKVRTKAIQARKDTILSLEAIKLHLLSGRRRYSDQATVRCRRSRLGSNDVGNGTILALQKLVESCGISFPSCELESFVRGTAAWCRSFLVDCYLSTSQHVTRIVIQALKRSRLTLRCTCSRRECFARSGVRVLIGDGIMARVRGQGRSPAHSSRHSNASPRFQGCFASE